MTEDQFVELIDAIVGKGVENAHLYFDLHRYWVEENPTYDELVAHIEEKTK